MTVSQAISTGLAAAWRNKALVTLFFACNLLLAAAVAAPMHSAIADHLGNSMTANELARGFSAPWLTEFQLAYSGFLKGFSTAIVYGGILFLVLNAVLSAGAFEVFSQRRLETRPLAEHAQPSDAAWAGFGDASCA